MSGIEVDFAWRIVVTMELADLPDIVWKTWSRGREETMSPYRATMNVHSADPSRHDGAAHNLATASVRVDGKRRLKSGKTSDYDLHRYFAQHSGQITEYSNEHESPTWLEPIVRDLVGRAAAMMAERLR